MVTEPGSREAAAIELVADFLLLSSCWHHACEAHAGPVGIDPAGCDLLHRTHTARIDFPEPVRTPGEARMALVALVKDARLRTGQAA